MSAVAGEASKLRESIQAGEIQVSAPTPRNFSLLEGKTDAQLVHVIREGGSAHGLSAAMPAHADLSEADLTGASANALYDAVAGS